MPDTLSPELLQKMDAYWRAANYLTVGQIYLKDNPLLEVPLRLEHLKTRLLGHWGTTTGLNFIYVHLNRLIKLNDLDMICIIGPGHGGPGLVAHTYLEGSYCEIYPNIDRSRNGMQRLFRQFSWPYGIPSHVAPETPGSIHEGGELGYSLAHAYGAAFDNPDLIVACIVGDGEAETGPLAASWHSNKFLNPARDGAVLPILHLNGFKIANPTVLARISRRGVDGSVPRLWLRTLFCRGRRARSRARASRYGARSRTCGDPPHSKRRTLSFDAENPERPRWPMIVFQTPKGWTGPKFVTASRSRVHGAPIRCLLPTSRTPSTSSSSKSGCGATARKSCSMKMAIPGGIRSARADGPAPDGSQPARQRRGASGAAVDAAFPGLRCRSRQPGGRQGRGHARPQQVFARRDEAESALAKFPAIRAGRNGLEPSRRCLQASPKEWMARVEDVDVDLSPTGRVMEVLSEHMCEGWLEGYLLTGRHGLFPATRRSSISLTHVQSAREMAEDRQGHSLA